MEFPLASKSDVCSNTLLYSASPNDCFYAFFILV